MEKTPDQAVMEEELPENNILEHIEALRFTLFKALGVYVFFCIPLWFFAPYLIKKLLAFASPPGFKLHYFTLMEPFFTQLELTAVGALLLAFPFILHFLWKFVAPALYPDEREKLRGPLAASLLLAYGGAAFAVFCVIPAIIRFSVSFSMENLQPVIGVHSFISLLLMLILASSVIFQFPLILHILLRLGLVTPEFLAEKRPIFVVVLFICAAVFTPPDPASQLMLALPAWGFFELAILWHRRKKSS